jgi:hypothetical protein
MKRSGRRVLSILLLCSCPGACQTGSPEVARVQEAVRSAAPGALANRAAPTTPAVFAESAAPRVGVDATTLPTVSNEGGVVRFLPDEGHQQIASVPVGARLAVTWTDGGHDGVWFGLTDLRGAAEGRGVRVHAAVEDEEHVASPTVVGTPEGFALAWVDGENGRVMFARLDTQRRLLAAPSIVHEGLEAPRTVTLAWNGRSFGVGVALWQGVYFAHLDARGRRADDGAMVSEGDAVTALHGVRWDRDRYVVAWTERRDGRESRVERRVDGRGVL